MVNQEHGSFAPANMTVQGYRIFNKHFKPKPMYKLFQQVTNDLTLIIMQTIIIKRRAIATVRFFLTCFHDHDLYVTVFLTTKINRDIEMHLATPM